MSRSPTIVTAIAMLFSLPGVAQNLEAIGKEKPVRLSGGLSLSQIGYGIKGIDERRDPYNYFLSGTLNIDVYGMSIPLSFMHSNQENTFRQPFNQFGLTPSYKAFTGHLGYASLSYSPYTLNGHIFLGIGIDYKPNGSKFSASAMYGRLQKAVQPDSTNENLVPSFQRMAYAIKLAYDDDGDFVHLIGFRAADDLSSLAYVPEKAGVLPQQNLVLSVQAGKQIGPLTLTGELATSALNRDMRVPEEMLESKNIFSYAGSLFHHTNASEYYNAYRTNLAYNAGFITIGIGYERIDPGYRTLGAYYFNNDLRNITLNVSSRLLQEKLNIASNIGTQRNNLDNQGGNNMRRFVGAVNVSYAPTNKLNLSASYSNFSTYTVLRSEFMNINQVIPVTNIDTLNYTQLSQSATVSASYSSGSSESVQRMWILNLSYQKATDKQGERIQDTGSRFINGNVACSNQIIPLQLGITIAANTNISTAGDLKSFTAGPTVALTKSLLKRKMQTGLSVSYNTQRINEQRNNDITNVRLTTSWKVRKHHNFSLSGIMLDKKSTEISSPDFTEYTVTLGYNYNF